MLVIVFFFFKQKTAYEMRISDWSSDVCSSDLAQYPFFHPAEYQRYFNDPKLIDTISIKAITEAQEPGSVMKPFTVAAALNANEALAAKGEKPEIGRASCRERVCQYV